MTNIIEVIVKNVKDYDLAFQKLKKTHRPLNR